MNSQRLPWFPCYASKLLGALAGMKADQKLVYQIVLLRIYEVGGPCSDPLDAIVQRVGLNKRRVSEALDYLFKVGKFERKPDGIINPFADQIIRDQTVLRTELSRAGQEGAKRRWKKHETNQHNGHGLPHTEAIATPIAFDAQLDLQGLSLSSKEELRESPVPKKGAGRNQYPDDFDSFWKSYPTDANMSKFEAFKEWQRLGPDDKKAAVDSVPGFVAFCSKDKTYRPIHANRYLSKRRFEGHLAAVKKQGKYVDISSSDASWNAWRSFYLDAGRRASVKLMDDAMNQRKTFPVPDLWPPEGVRQ